jgi:hypothetical protein
MGMYQTIDESIVVAGVYRGGKFEPKKFQWGRQTIEISAITLVSDVKDGGVKKRYFSVISGNNVYRLIFNRESEQWYLGELWIE